VDKYGSDGKLLPEMILVCNALLSDLKHPNEYIRGCTLRFLCRINEAELVEPLVSTVKENLEHRHSYVRKNAVMAVYTISKNFGDDLMPDADELIEKFLQNETDANARRNAFLMLYQCSQDKAIDFFANNLDNVQKFGDGFQLVILELTRKVCRSDPSQKSRFIKVIFQLLQSPSAAVCYEAAWTLVSLSSAPTAVRAAASTYTQLLASESDNNVKLIVLEKLMDMRQHHPKILQELLMDIMRALSSPNSDIRRKTLDISMELISPRNINEVVSVLKKELTKTQSKDVDKMAAAEYRQMLIKAIHGCAIRFANVADSVIHLLMDFLGGQGALDVIMFVREIVEIYPKMRVSVIKKLIDCLPEIKASNVYRVALWVLGEYTETRELKDDTTAAIFECLGDLPFVTDVPSKEEDDEEEYMSKSISSPQGTVSVLADGTYATQTAFTTVKDESSLADSGPFLRKLMLVNGNYLLGAVAMVTLTKIAMKLSVENEEGAKPLCIRVLITCCAMIQAGKVAKGSLRMDKDSYERLSFCIRALLDPSVKHAVSGPMLKECRVVFQNLIEKERKALKSKENEENQQAIRQPDELLSFRQLKSRSALGASDIDLDDETSLANAAGSGGDFAAELAHVYQLTGFSDPVYAETQITVHDYDIVLDILIINRTNQTLSNVGVELNTVGDLKLVERPQSFSLKAHESRKFKSNVKVSSTETGSIFGCISFDSNTGASNVVNLNEIPVEIMDYIKPAVCSDSAFRSMWAEFEWENKVAVNTQLTDVNSFLQHIIFSTNMSCLTPTTSLGGQCNFLAANLYAKSVFGEDALVNVSVEKVAERVEGYIRIRAKTQGIALSLGDRITMMQKAPSESKKNLS